MICVKTFPERPAAMAEPASQWRLTCSPWGPGLTAPIIRIAFLGVRNDLSVRVRCCHHLWVSSPQPGLQRLDGKHRRGVRVFKPEG